MNPSETTKGGILLSAVLTLGILFGLQIGWKLWHTKPTVEAYAPGQRQGDGSLVLERKPMPGAKPVQPIPAGAKVERIVQVVVERTRGARDAEMPPISGSAPVADAPLLNYPQPMNPIMCPPVRVDLTLIRMPDQSRRVIASSPDGRVTGGVDIPVENEATPKELKWASGAVYGGTAWGDKTLGVFLDRDFSFLRMGVELTRNTYATQARQGWEVRTKLGIRF